MALGSYATEGRHTDGWFRLDRQIRAAHRGAELAIRNGHRRDAARLIAQANRLIAQRDRLLA